MTKSWLITGIVREKPRLPPCGEYNGEDVFSPNQPKRGQVDEMLMNFSGKSVLIVCFDPSGCTNKEEAAQEVKDSVLWALEGRHEDDPVLVALKEGSTPKLTLFQIFFIAFVLGFSALITIMILQQAGVILL